jgi:LysR family nitrogen assimilation transcriptional regulator
MRVEMNIKLLESFLRVVEFGSINRAAKELGLTQPALSRSLSELERDVGRPLLIRRRRGVALTDAGMILAARSAELLRHAASIREELSDEPAARLVIGMPTPLRNQVTIPLVTEMRRIAPKTRIRIFEGFNIYIKDLLNQGLLDVAILPENLVPVADFEQIPLAREPILLFRKLSLPELASPVPLKEVVRYSMAMPGRPNVVRTMVETALKAAHLPMPDVVLEPENMEIAHSLVRSGCVDQCAGIGNVFANNVPAEMWVSTIEGLEMRWILAINRHRTHMPAVRRINDLIGKIVFHAVKEQTWRGASSL